MHTFKLKIRTPEKEVYVGKAKELRLKTELGVVKILAGHADLTGVVNFTPLVFIDEENVERDYVAKRGLLRVSNKDKAVDLMVFDCTLKSELSPITAKQYLKFVEEELAKGADLSAFKIKFLQEEKYVLEKQIKHLE